MTHHSELINSIIQKIGAQTYMEIGVFNPDHNYNHIKVPMKCGVDPDPKAGASWCVTSDDAFMLARESGTKFDIIFIDGLHHADQVKKDLINAWERLNIGGVMIVHDCNPQKEEITHVPRDSREWCGDVYKAWSSLMHYDKFTIHMDYGCGVLRKDEDSNLMFSELEIGWHYFDQHRLTLLNLVDVDEAWEIINSWNKKLQHAH